MPALPGGLARPHAGCRTLTHPTPLHAPPSALPSLLPCSSYCGRCGVSRGERGLERWGKTLLPSSRSGGGSQSPAISPWLFPPLQEYIDPISQELMIDPVLLVETGQVRQEEAGRGSGWEGQALDRQGGTEPLVEMGAGWIEEAARRAGRQRGGRSNLSLRHSSCGAGRDPSSAGK